jgi:hypothetical protein
MDIESSPIEPPEARKTIFKKRMEALVRVDPYAC